MRHTSLLAGLGFLPVLAFVCIVGLPSHAHADDWYDDELLQRDTESLKIGYQAALDEAKKLVGCDGLDRSSSQGQHPEKAIGVSHSQHNCQNDSTKNNQQVALLYQEDEQNSHQAIMMPSAYDAPQAATQPNVQYVVKHEAGLVMACSIQPEGQNTAMSSSETAQKINAVYTQENTMRAQPVVFDVPAAPRSSMLERGLIKVQGMMGGGASSILNGVKSLLGGGGGGGGSQPDLANQICKQNPGDGSCPTAGADMATAAVQNQFQTDQNIGNGVTKPELPASKVTSDDKSQKKYKQEQDADKKDCQEDSAKSGGCSKGGGA